MGDEFILSTKDLLLIEDLLPAQTSFAAPNLNVFVKFVINIREVSTGTVRSIPLLNREVSSDIEGWPLILSISNAGARNGEFLPSTTRGVVVLDNRPNSFNVSRRFSDLMENYTLIDQEFAIGVALLPLEDETLQDSDFVEKFRGVITGADFQGDTVRLSLTTNLIPTRVATRAIDSDTFTDAPTQSLGRHLPIIFSDSSEYIEIEPMQVTEMYEESGENKIDYAYATTFADQYLVGNASGNDVKVFIEDQNRDFQEITFVSDPDTAILEFAPVASGGSDVGSIADTWEELSELAYKLADGEGGIEAGHTIVGCDWILAGQETDTTASITAKIWSESNGYPLNVLSSDTIELSETAKFTETTYNGVACTRFHFAFPRPSVVPDGGALFVSFSLPKDPNSDFLPFIYDGGAGGLSAYEEYTLLDLDGYRTDFRRQIKTAARHHLSVYALAYTDTPNACATGDLKEGLGYSTFTLRMRDQDNVPNLGAARYIAKSKGLRDDASGTITGAANFRLTTPLYQAHLLLMEWDGTDWVETIFDETKYSNSHSAAFDGSGRWEIRTAGASQGRRTVDGLLDDICRSGGSRIVAYGNTSSSYLGLYAHGTSIASSFTLTDENCKLRRFSISGRESVVNRIIAIYNRTIQTRTESLLAEGGLNNYLALTDSDEETLDITGTDVTNSVATWGNAEIRDQTYPWVTTSASMLSIIGLTMRRNNSPTWDLEVEVPYHIFKDIQPMDFVTLNLTGLPNYTGTFLSRQRDSSSGDYLHAYQAYTAQVEGVSFSLNKQQILTLVLYLRRKDPADV